MWAYKIRASSMSPALFEGDYVYTRKVLRPRKRGDIIVFKYPENRERHFVNRVVAVEGDVIKSVDKVIYINNEVVDEPFVIHSDKQIKPEGLDTRDNFGPFVVPEGSYFVMGDNRDASYDSRFWGFLTHEDILYQAMVIYFSWDEKASSPRFSRIGKVLHE